MGALDDDDEREHYAFGGEDNDEWDDTDERDLVPDEMATVRCQRCKKLILEDSIRCPYCKEMQLEVHHNRMPLWFVITAVLLILLTIAYYVFDAPNHAYW